MVQFIQNFRHVFKRRPLIFRIGQNGLDGPHLVLILGKATHDAFHAEKLGSKMFRLSDKVHDEIRNAVCEIAQNRIANRSHCGKAVNHDVNPGGHAGKRDGRKSRGGFAETGQPRRRNRVQSLTGGIQTIERFHRLSGSGFKLTVFKAHFYNFFDKLVHFYHFMTSFLICFCKSSNNGSTTGVTKSRPSIHLPEGVA